MPNENQFYQHCQRYDSFDDEPVPGWSREEKIDSCLEWEMEEVYPEGHEEADWGSTVTHWMLVPMPGVSRITGTKVSRTYLK
ncbi:MAG: hypothetical protein EOO61_11640 [Hymenobacter sp.]|nr:MAG: hypothetical protein EOO61_11640 [Hymenobacter sp.]